MEPDACLNEIRELLVDLETSTEYFLLGDVHDLVDRVRALDEWLSKGGFLPEVWQRPT